MNELRNLIGCCIKGDRQAQGELYGIYSQKMFIVCMRYSPNREEAEDTLQEGFIKVFTNLRQYQFNGAFEGWVRKIMVNCALQKYRIKSNLRTVVIEDDSIIEYYNEDILSRLGTKDLLTMIQNLPPAYRLIFNMYVFEGKKHREIAEELGISEGTSKSNLHDARNILQRKITKSMAVAVSHSQSSVQGQIL